jgi:hypothetical protein
MGLQWLTGLFRENGEHRVQQDEKALSEPLPVRQGSFSLKTDGLGAANSDYRSEDESHALFLSFIHLRLDSASAGLAN